MRRETFIHNAINFRQSDLINKTKDGTYQFWNPFGIFLCSFPAMISYMISALIPVSLLVANTCITLEPTEVSSLIVVL